MRAGNDGFGNGLGGISMIFMGLFWIALIIGIILLIRWVWPIGKVSKSAEDSPLETLKRRYARGEINREEFEQKKKDLGNWNHQCA